MLHLIGLLDNGIRKRILFKGGEEAERWRFIHSVLKPVMILAVIFYILSGQFEKPAWCMKIDDQIEADPDLAYTKYQGWNSEYCNDDNMDFTSWFLPKFPISVMQPIECVILVFLLFMQWIRNQYRDLDSGSSIWFKVQLVLTTVVIGETIINLLVPKYPYPWASAFIRPIMLLTIFRALRKYLYLYVRVVKESLPMVCFIVVYILYFSWFAYTIF